MSATYAMQAERARKIAQDWHGGQWSALYAFASTGRLTDADLPRAVHEVERDRRECTDDTSLDVLLTWLVTQAKVRGIRV